MNKQELLEELESNKDKCLKEAKKYEVLSWDRQIVDSKALVYMQVINWVEQLAEQPKVTVPQFVAEYLELTKKEEFSFDAVFVHVKKMPERVWLWKRENQETFLRAWLDGYEVKEPLYQIELPGTSWGAYLTKADNGDLVIFQNTTSGSTFTESEIKAIDERYWAFAVPVEEVK